MLKFDSDKRSFWQRVFMESKVNGAPYFGEQLPGQTWKWPKNTYLQRRLRYARGFQFNERRNLN